MNIIDVKIIVSRSSSYKKNTNTMIITLECGAKCYIDFIYINKLHYKIKEWIEPYLIMQQLTENN